MKKIQTIIFLVCLTTVCFGQLNDDFSDGDLLTTQFGPVQALNSLLIHQSNYNLAIQLLVSLTYQHYSQQIILTATNGKSM